jgi:glutathione S-transferase
MSFTLILGNKAYSSWSLRPWIALKQAGIPFEETVIPIYMDGSSQAIRRFSRAGKVPILKDGDFTVWDSLSIIEYVAEKYPKLWPADSKARAVARSISAEMHSGFVPLRKLCTMNTRRHYPNFELTDEANENVARIDAIFSEARSEYGRSGPFLFGEWTGADAMYAPVVTRFKTYDVTLSKPAQDYCDAVLDLPAMKEWYAAAEAEPWHLPQYEY